MTPLQTLEIRAGEIRARLAEIGGMADLDDETRAELATLRREYQDCEHRQTALRIAGDAPGTPIETRTGEGREFRGLLGRANVGNIFTAAFDKGVTSGAEAELQQHYGMGPNQVPLSLLIRSFPEDGELETRAVTPAPTNVGQQQQSIVPYVFPQAAATFLGVDMPSVPVGEVVYPVLTSTLSAEALAENAAGTETTGAFSGDVLTPSRLQASFFYSREDRARFAGMDDALRMNLSDGLGDALDNQILAGANGLFTGTNLANHAATAVTTFANYISEFAYGRVDGRYASMAADLRVVMGAETYAHAGNVYRNNNVDRTALDRLMEITGGVRVSAHVPDAASDKQNAVIRRGMNMAMVAPLWEAVTIIPDEVTKAASGQIVVTALTLHAVKILRTDDWYKQETQHA